jgi:tetratricopeptide (TPR) repeat protein
LLREILERGPSDETLCLVLTELKKAGHTRTVIRECHRALQQNPEAIPLRLLLAEAYVEEGRLSQAEAEIETAASRVDRYASVYLIQAEIYRTQRRKDEALRALTLYLAHRPEDEKALEMLKDLQPPKAAPPTEEAPQELPEPAMAEASEFRIPPPAEPPPEEEAQLPEFKIEEEVLPEIATPTLAEVYVNQGQIQEALSIYEKVVSQNPEDLASVTRIEKLKTMLTAEPRPAKKTPSVELKKQKTIAVLESWLANIRKMSEDTAPV